MITKRFTFEQTDDRPDTMERGVVYVVGEEQPDMMMLVCPCGCDGVIYLGMHPQSQPCFRLEGLTIIPAIQRTVGCQSHFAIRNGAVENRK